METIISIADFNNSKKIYSEAIIKNAHVMNGVKHIEIPVGLIVLDEEYQRGASNYTHKIACEWDNHKAKDIIVSYRDYEFKCVDGANRVRAAIIAGQNTVNCIVYEGLTEQDEARLFAEQNDYMRRVTTSEKFNARVVAMDPTSLEIEKVCDEFGVKIRNTYPHQIGAVSGVKETEAVFKRFGHDGLSFVFQAIRDMNWHSCKNAYSAAVIGAFAHAFEVFGGSMTVVSALCKAFGEMNPDEFIARSIVEFKNRGRKRATMAFVEKILATNLIG